MKKITLIVITMQILDLLCTIYFVHYLAIAVEFNPVLESVFSLILAKIIFSGIYLLYYLKKGTTNEFKWVSRAIISIYLVAFSSSFLSFIVAH